LLRGEEHAAHAAPAKLALDGVRVAESALELLAKIAHRRSSGVSILTRLDYCCRRPGIGIGMFNAVAPAPTPPSHVLGGTVPTPRVDGRSAAQNM